VEEAASTIVTGGPDVDWSPEPIDTTDILLPDELVALLEQLAENAHDNWGQQRMSDGWRYGPTRDDDKRTHPLLVPYAELLDADKEYDRRLAAQTLKLIIKLGYQILPRTT
jgi:hypothetical protein